MSKDCITIYTDASFCPNTKIGGWACWVKYDDGKSFKAYSGFKEKPVCSTHAEIRAIGNALVIVMKKLNPTNKIIVVVTDSKEAILRISGTPFLTAGKTSERNKLNEKLWKDARFAASLIPTCCELRLKKVRAHSDNDGKRSYVNNLVDVLAKKAMKKKRAENGK